ncbi:hypothetical protein lerEdw1_010048 [Lerista edwardsae]|nr:hypothetical protein lerEdw1_010048 [Lerista edwardsae]
MLSSPASLFSLFVQLGNSLFHEEPLPYLVHQPLPWQVQYVTQSRRASRDSGKGGSSRHNSIYSVVGRRGDDSPTRSSESTEPRDPAGKAAVTGQKHRCTHHQRQK